MKTGLLGPRRSHCRHHLTTEPGPTLKRTTVVIFALVAERRQELVNQISVRRMDLHDAESGLAGPARRRRKRVDHS